MSLTGWLLLAVLVLALLLVGAALVAFRPDTELGRRPLPYPRSHRHHRKAEPLAVPSEAWVSGDDSTAWWRPVSEWKT